MTIEPKTTPTQELFHGIGLQYRVPRYQRDYAWIKEQTEQLWQDLLLASQSEQDYFLGSIVLMKEAGSQQHRIFQIVDGQQRLTTITILLCAIRDLSRHYLINPDNDWCTGIAQGHESSEGAQRCVDYTTQAIVYAGEPDRYYLTINDKDQAVFRDRVQTPQLLPPPNSADLAIRGNEPRITKAWKNAVNWLHSEFLSHPDGFEKLKAFTTYCLTRVYFLAIYVTDDVDAYLLFESLNDRGLELSIADLVKNRLMIVASPDQTQVDIVVSEWDALTRELEASRFGVKDYLRFYWTAFHSPCTSKQLYSKIKERLTPHNVRSELLQWRTHVPFFLQLTSRTQVFPSARYGFDTLESLHAQMATLKYSLCIPFLLAVNKERPALNKPAAKSSLAYLFRVVTAADVSAGKADSLFRSCRQGLKDNESDEDILRRLSDSADASDESFIANLSTRTFEDNSIARYLLTCIHLYNIGGGATPDSTIELEHILPQNEQAWPEFDTLRRKKSDWIYNIGNMTLLEERINAAIKDREFSVKVERYRKRSSRDDFSIATSIPMTYELHNQYSSDPVDASLRAWTASRISERARVFAQTAAAVFDVRFRSNTAGKRASRMRRRAP